MEVVIAVAHADKELFASANNVALTSLFAVEPYKVEISSYDEMFFWIREFVTKLKESINFNEASALSQFNPVFRVGINFSCHNCKKTHHYKMDTLLLHVYGLDDKKLREVSDDLFQIFAQKQIEHWQESMERSFS